MSVLLVQRIDYSWENIKMLQQKYPKKLTYLVKLWQFVQLQPTKPS